ncbi:MAG TPA: hypothetical protein VE567_02135 [Sphingomonas sp.]|nr:hypothetical protein [Sphingomonas sp.]
MGKRLIRVAVLSAAPFAIFPAAAKDTSPAQAGIEIGRCIVKADRQSAISMLKRLPLTGGEMDWSSVSLGTAASCRNASSPPVTVTALRGGIAQELFKRDFVEYGVQPQRSISDLARFDLPVEKNTMGVEEPTKTLFLTADCVARSNPSGAEMLIKTAPGSQQEMKIFELLGPWLSSCQGANRMAYGKTELRSAIVQAAYHVSQRYWAGEMTYAGPAFRPEGVR